MNRKWCLAALVAVFTLLLGGCTGLWPAAKHEVTLQVQGLSKYEAAQSIWWTAVGSGTAVKTGSVKITGSTMQIPLALATGTWQVSVEVRDDDGAALFTDTKQLVVDNNQEIISFTATGAGSDDGAANPPDDEPGTPPDDDPGTTPDPPSDPGTPPTPPDDDPGTTPEPPALTWKAWNGDMQPTPTGLLQGENGYKTPYYIIDSGVAGPVMLINGGMHGDEPAGSLAAWRLVTYKLRRGKLIVIPELNRMGLQAGVRSGGYPGDPNRDYPQEQGQSADDKLSRSIWQMLQDQHVTWLMDLHEGYSYHKVNSASVGQSIIQHKGTSAQHEQRDKVVNKMLSAVNSLVSADNHKFSHLHNPVSGSLARAAGDYLNVAAMTIETCDKQSLSLRIKEHEIMVHTAMQELGML